MFGYLLITPPTSCKPSQQSQYRFGVSFGKDGLFSLVESRAPLALRGAEEAFEARAGRQRVSDRAHQAGDKNVPIAHYPEGVSGPSQFLRGPAVMLHRQHPLQS